MNRIEAIQYFEQLKRRFTEVYDKSNNYFEKLHCQTTIDAVNQALEALKEKDGVQ